MDQWFLRSVSSYVCVLVYWICWWRSVHTIRWYTGTICTLFLVFPDSQCQTHAHPHAVDSSPELVLSGFPYRAHLIILYSSRFIFIPYPLCTSTYYRRTKPIHQILRFKWKERDTNWFYFSVPLILPLLICLLSFFDFAYLFLLLSVSFTQTHFYSALPGAPSISWCSFSFTFNIFMSQK